MLAYEKTDRAVRFISSRECAGANSSFANFVQKFDASELNAHHVALNFLGRYKAGGLDLRVTEERILVAMLAREELLKLSERQLAAEYARIVGSGPKRIKPASAEKYVDEMLAKLAEDANKVGGSKGETEPATKKTRKPRAVKAPRVPKAPKEPREKKPRVSKPLGKIEAGTNPFREGTMKAAGFDFYLKNKSKDKESRQKVVDFMVKAGASESTAKSWYGMFVSRTSAG